MLRVQGFGQACTCIASGSIPSCGCNPMHTTPSTLSQKAPLDDVALHPPLGGQESDCSLKPLTHTFFSRPSPHDSARQAGARGAWSRHADVERACLGMGGGGEACGADRLIRRMEAVQSRIPAHHQGAVYLSRHRLAAGGERVRVTQSSSKMGGLADPVLWEGRRGHTRKATRTVLVGAAVARPIQHTACAS